MTRNIAEEGPEKNSYQQVITVEVHEQPKNAFDQVTSGTHENATRKTVNDTYYRWPVPNIKY